MGKRFKITGLIAALALFSCSEDSGISAPTGPVITADELPQSGDGTPVDRLGGELSPIGTASPFTGSLLQSFPLSQVVSGGVPKDGIPALTNPPAVDPSGVGFLAEEDLVLGLVIDGVARAYPENLGWRHEIVNDEIGGHSFSVTFCPLTGTGLVFEAADGGPLELGVSGRLFNNNLVMYDRRDGETLYPQLYFTGVSGSDLPPWNVPISRVRIWDTQGG
jgi:hypothetical protein